MSTVQHPVWPYARISAHRGGGTLAPENTLEAFRTGLRYGFAAMETDAMLASDGVPILMHDEVFGRTIRDREGSVPQLTSLEVRTLDAGSWFSPEYCGVPPAGFEQTVRWCRANRCWLNVEIKPAKGHEAETGRVVAKMTRELYADLIAPTGGTREGIVPAVPLMSSFKIPALEAALAVAPELPRGFLFDEVPDDWVETAKRLQCVSVHMNQRRTTPELVEHAHAEGFWVFCYTVNSPVRLQELWRMGVDAVCTDRLDIVRPCL